MKLKKNINYNTRIIHRYLGVIIGVQFLLWTLGGLYFSWNNMDDVHGDTLLKQEKHYFSEIDYSKIQIGIDSLKSFVEVDSIHSIKIVEVFEKTIAQFRYFEEDEIKIQLIEVESGNLKPAFTEKECLMLAEKRLKNPIPIAKTEFLEEVTSNHHEYRKKPLPVYAFTLDHPTNTTIYVSAELGQITSIRNNNWRRFDFLWMLHTMDYSTRDHITNWVLRIFSIFGIFTIISGFYLFFLTSPTINKIKKK